MAKRSGLPWWAWVPFLPVLFTILMLWRSRRPKKQNRVDIHRDSIPLPPDLPLPPLKSQDDDLTVLKGVGLKSAAVLRAAGITTFALLSQTPVAQLQEILEAAGMRILDPSTWPEQARQQIYRV